MVIRTHPQFDKHYRQRILPNPKLDQKFSSRLAQFTKNPKNPLLKDHSLTGEKKMYRSFWVTGDIRVVYYPLGSNEVLFTDIGSHNQVY